MESKPEDATQAPKPEVEENGTAAKKDVEEEKAAEKTHDVDYGDPEEKEKVQAAGLKDVEVKTGLEGEVCIYKQRVKLYRWAKDVEGKEMIWKERGVGNAKMMRDEKKLRIRVVMRQEKTMKPVANFVITEAPSCVLTNMNNNEKALMWAC